MRNFFKNRIGLLALLVVLLSHNGWAGWSRDPVGSGMGWTSGVACGPGRDDGINRIYAAGWNRLYEFTWNGLSWDPMDMGVTSGWEVALGEGRNDG